MFRVRASLVLGLCLSLWAAIAGAQSQTADERRERFERLPPEQQVRYLRGLPPDLRRELGDQLSPETRARIRDQILEERLQRMERQAERKGTMGGKGAETPARRLSDEERKQLREQVTEAHRKRDQDESRKR